MKKKGDTINSFISDPTSVNKHVYQIMNSTLGEQEQENLTEETLVSDANIIPVLKNSRSILVEIELGKTLNINPNLTPNDLWKLNPSDRTIALTKFLIKHAKLQTKETEIGA